MGIAVRSSKKPMLEDKIESFCQSATELLTNIHERCDNQEVKKTKKKSKRGRPKKNIE